MQLNDQQNDQQDIQQNDSKDNELNNKLNNLLGNSENKTNDKIHEILFNKDDVTWQTIIYELIKSEEIDPWDINISLLTQKYIEVIKNFKKFDFNISGKALLAAAILLRIKSNRLVGEDISDFDRIIAGEPDEDFFEEEIISTGGIKDGDVQNLIPRLPQPRKRKVSIYDLMGALEKALEVKQRRVLKNTPSFNIEIPKKKPNVNLVIQSLYLKIKNFFLSGNSQLTFSNLIPTDSREDKISTFIPLLHLSNRQKINLEQKEAFSEIFINLKSNQEINKELKKN
jgi:segregation and condensation protein A